MRRRIQWQILGAILAGGAFIRSNWHLQEQRRSLLEAERSLARRNEQVAALSNVLAQIADELSFENVVNATLRETGRIMGANMVSLRRLEGEKLVSIGAMLRDGRMIRLTSTIPLGVGLTGKAAAEKRTVRIGRNAELRMDPHLIGGVSSQGPTPSPAEQMQGRRQESGIIAPLIVGQRTVGALAVWSTEVDHFTAEDEGILSLMASQVATALVAASIMEERDRQAHLDALTSLPNRLQLAKDMEGELAALAGLGRSAVFAMVDIDRFKSYNDGFGHSAGDIVLQNIGEVMRGCIRPTDHIYRYGGEEFLVVFMDTGPEEGARLAECLRQAVSLNLNAMRSVTVSIGLASLPRDGSAPGELIDLADKAMYRAKNSGRDRTVDWGAVHNHEAVA